MSTGFLLKEHRKEKGLSIGDVSERLGVSKQTVMDWENGDLFPKTDVLIQLSLLYDISLASIIEEKNSNNSQQKTEPRRWSRVPPPKSDKRKRNENFIYTFSMILFLGVGYLFDAYVYSWMFFVFGYVLVEYLEKKKSE